MEKQGIELLSKPAPSEKSTVISFWAKTVGVSLIIGLQLLFLGIFTFRIKLEADLRTLAASVEEKEAILSQSEEFERAFRNTQKRLDLIDKSQLELRYSHTVKKLKTLTPSGVTITSISLEKEALALSAETLKGTSFTTFVAKILEEEAIQEASITSGNLDKEGKFAFTMELSLNKDKLR